MKRTDDGDTTFVLMMMKMTGNSIEENVMKLAI